MRHEHPIRIREHRIVKAGSLRALPGNVRTHSTRQRKLLQAMLKEVGFARSVAAYVEPSTSQLTLIDGHLRVELDRDADVVVEVLDVTPEDARKLHFAMDRIADLAGTDVRARQSFFNKLNWTHGSLRSLLPKPAFPRAMPREPQYVVLVQCPGEAEQIKLLQRLLDEGHACKAVQA